MQIRARYPYERTTPVTRLSTQEMVTLIGIAAASRASVRRIVGVEAIGINACPCAQGLVRDQASERLLDAGFDAGDVERILELVPIATHNQRGQGTLLVGTSRRVNAERLVELVEASMSSPIYELLKRPDELFVVEHAHLQPRFVEDSVRVALKSLLDELPDLDDGDFVLLPAVELRDDPRARGRGRALRHGRRAAGRARRRRARAAAAHGAPRLAAGRVAVRGPPSVQRRARLPREARLFPWMRRRMFARCSTRTAAAATPAKAITGHG